jgi:hypothetical protein
MPQLICQSVVKELLRAGIRYQGDSLAKYLGSQSQAPIWDITLVRNPEIREKFWQAMVELQKELVPHHIGMQVLHGKLWGLFREVVLNKAAFQSGANLQNKIDDFSKEVKKPLMAFDVIYEIKNFDIGDKNFNLGDVEIFKLTSDHLRGLVFSEEASSVQTSMVNEWVGRSVAMVEVNAADTDGANILGNIEVNNALNVLRLAVRKEFISRSSDSLFLWALGDSIVIPKIKPRKGVLFSLFDNREFYPFKADLGNMIVKLLEDKSIWRFILGAKLPEDINIRIRRAIEWISHSITVSNLDYKLVNLCTALEILLLPDHQNGRKGEPIALRQVLVGRNVYCNPTAILYLYEKRCSIIHGGYFGITSFSDYRYLLACCFLVLEGIVRLSQKNPHIHNLRELLGIAENRETLEKFIEHCKLGIHEGKGINKIKKVAEDLLKKYQ